MPKYNIFAPEQRLVVKYKGLFDLQGLYSLIRSWYDKRGFEFHENLYKTHEPKTGNMEVFIKGFRHDTPYMQVWVDVIFRLWDLHDVEVIHAGKKKQMMKARLTIQIESWIETDYERKWEKSKFFVSLRDFYEKYIIKRKIEMYINKIEYEVHNFQNALKKELKMEATGGAYTDMW